MLILTHIALPPVLVGPLRVTVLLNAPPPGQALNELSHLATQLFQLARLGAYVPEGIHPKDASFEVTEERRLLNGIVWDCRVNGIDHRIAQLLRNDLVMYNQVYHPVQRMEIEILTKPPLPAGHLPALGSKSLSDTYPPQFGNLSFNIKHEPLEYSGGGRRVEIVFSDFLSDQAVKQILDWLDLWADVSRGAYAENESDAETGECAIFDAEADIVDDHAIEMLIEMFGAPEQAWNSLLNLCERISSNIARVSMVIIQ
jgi:hypothetical protein